MNNKNKIIEWFSKKENWLISISVFFVLMAFISPLLIYLRYKGYGDYTGLAGLGPIGDFIGGSTMAFFNIASFTMLVATIFMQKEELSLQREEIKKTRQEYNITNMTMKKQQFETTFFNMINLHHNILKEIKGGKAFFKQVYGDVKNAYQIYAYDYHQEKFISEILEGDIEKLQEFVEHLHINMCMDQYITSLHKNSLTNQEYKKIKVNIMNGNDLTWNEFAEKQLTPFRGESYDKEKYEKFIREIDFRLYTSEVINPSHILIKKFVEDYSVNPNSHLKQIAYEYVYEKDEDIIGHYYRNLYRIVKLIQESEFDSDNPERDEIEKRKYRGILRAQLSSIELLMLFYNVNYSKKGEKFKALLENTNFFDDHLVEKEFIWKNDKEELKYFAKIGN
ncbi:putative phage abortive infection protein [Priestia aryabhattai]|uniref:putative phage abortive infection protein n=1 Tax=Priestia aryabhattai TaxID=412384 RepID=UPI0030D16B32